jgi:hypothetical protein
LLCAVGMQIISVSAVFAQETAIALKSPSTAITIDGNNKEWGDSLAYYNADSKINYAIANDKENIYLVIKTNDLAKQNYILSSGVTFSIDTKGRSKKSGFAVTFPEAGQEAMKRSATLEENKLRLGLLTFRKIGVKGFKDIDDDEIALSNALGIQIAIGFDDKGYMTYEEAIPLDLFHAGELAKGEWTFNVKLNPPAKPQMPSMGSEISTAGLPGFASAGKGSGKAARVSPAGSRSKPNPGETEEQKPIDFWGRLKLAQ